MNIVRQIFKAGFFHILGAGSINAILTLVLNIVVVRLLTVEDYGAYAYAFSIVGFFVLFNALGAPSAAMQICSELFKARQESDARFSYAYKAGAVVDGCMLVVIALIGALVPLAIPGSNALLILYCAYPLLAFLNEMKLSYLRIWLRNKEYASMTNVQTILLVVLSGGGAFLFQAPGLIIGQNLALLLSWLICCVRFPYRRLALSASVEAPAKRDYWKVALVSALNNGLGGALSLLGTFLIGLLLMSDELVASYKVASTIPFGLLFIPSLLATFVYPHFVRNKGDRAWTIRSFVLLLVGSVAVMGSITVVGVLFSTQIMVLFFGAEYESAASAFSILMVGFFVTAAGRRIAGNLLVSQRRLFFNTFIGVLSIVITLVLSLLLIPAFGIEGAAWAYALTMLSTGIISTVYYVSVIWRLPRRQQVA